MPPERLGAPTSTSATPINDAESDAGASAQRERRVDSGNRAARWQATAARSTESITPGNTAIRMPRRSAAIMQGQSVGLTALPASVSWDAGNVDEETSQPICTTQIYRRSAEREGNEGELGHHAHGN